MNTKGLILGILLLIIATSSTAVVFKIFQGGQNQASSSEELPASSK